MTTSIKTCFKCGEIKSINDFYRHPQMADGRLGKCKECTKIDVRRNRRRRLSYYTEFDRARAMLPHRVAAREAYQKTEAGRASIRRSTSRFRRLNPAKTKAHAKVSYAIRSGKLVRLPCEICGEGKAHAHHDDYSKPLEVRWLCAEHHAEWHKHNDPVVPESNDDSEAA